MRRLRVVPRAHDVHRGLGPRRRRLTRPHRTGAQLACVPCDCHGHSSDCNPYSSVCIGCGGNTEGAHCQQCEDGFFRYLNVTDFGVCPAYCDLAPGEGNCDTMALEDACLPCADQCFGANKTTCDKQTGQCLGCASQRAEGVRCEACAVDTWATPWQTSPASRASATTGEHDVDGRLRSKHDRRGLAPSGGGRSRLAAPRWHQPDGHHHDGRVRRHHLQLPRRRAAARWHARSSRVAQCESCNAASFFGNATTCVTPGADGSELGDCVALRSASRATATGTSRRTRREASTARAGERRVTWAAWATRRAASASCARRTSTATPRGPARL